MSSLGSAFSFAPARVFVLTGGQLSVFHWRRGLVDLPGATFYADEQGLQGFAAYLAETADLPSYLLVDMVEEEFRHDTIPHVLGPDRKALLNTRRNRVFRDTDYSSAIIQGREAEGRRDDIVLLSALIRPELMSPWLARIAQMKVPLVGIYSVPVISEALIPKLSVESNNVLLVTLQSAGGLRQSFFRDGKLHVSRLAVAPRMEPAQQAPYILGEVERVQRYLNSLRVLAPGVPLDVVLLTGRRVLNDLRRQSRDTMLVRFHALDLKDVGPQHGCKTELATPYADALFAHLLARSSPPNFYATSEDRRHMTHHRLRGAMTAASILALLGGMAFSGVQYVQSVLIKRETASLKEHASFYEERYNKGREGQLEIPAEPYEMRQAVELASALQQYKTDPLPTMLALSEGLIGFERIQIDRFDWAAAGDPDAEIGERGGVLTRTNDFNAPRAPADAEPGIYYQMARVRGRVVPFDGDYRQALDLVNRFARALDRLDDIESVRVIRQPFDVSSRRRLSGDAARSNQRAQASFELRIVVPVDTNPEPEADEKQEELADGGS
ncbi:MAG: hypothetical protein AAF458_15930 [Pseudomonadota bacterium]